MTDVSGADAPDPQAPKAKAKDQADVSGAPAVVTATAEAPAAPEPPVAPSPEDIQTMINAAVAAALEAKAAADDAAERAKRDAELPNASAVQRQLDAEAAAVAASGMVVCRVLKAGDGKISKGYLDLETNADAVFAFADKPTLPRLIAEALEARNFVEIQGEA